ncbi:DUF11 domain-containing protein [Phototrophicus methaneseepsis]|uniref:DUF11 domain-containing protein n=1 Tax=Phototrophicus methaneseepsis TaxID=2710758 RepID=A0A7S8E7R3_9CHLR|nr:DUF11 domain-containing protein [Phototrophicus methaneseepsis]QPC81940.1 DUF11 domain-containing protein [Phototrophicus methaneseepsis]
MNRKPEGFSLQQASGDVGTVRENILFYRSGKFTVYILMLIGFAFLLFSSAATTSAQASNLTITPLTWNIVGLDSNSPTSGPYLFPVGARVCATTATTNINVTFSWQTANTNINLRSGSLSTINIPSLSAAQCTDAYFEIEVNRVAGAYETARRYVITASDGSSTASTPTPRELYVERLISQNRNATTNIRFGTSLPSLTSVAPGGSMNLLVGNTYYIELTGNTATQGYEQLETFISLANTVFRILSVSTTYTANTSPYVSTPNDKLYADACLWENDPNSPNYRACLDSGKKAGGTIVTTYQVQIIGGGGTTQSLNSLIYDFSGASFHYNSDYGVGARFANIIDPTSVDISKRFAPATTSVGGTSTLIFTLTNPNGGAISGYNFVDNLPAGMQVASTPSATTSGCGTPTFAPTAGATSLSFSNGTVAGNSTCTISVNVTTSAANTYTNTTNNLFVGTVDTGKTATADLTVTTAPPPPTCTSGLSLATWTFPLASSATNPAATSSTVTTSSAAGLGGTTPSRAFINSLTYTGTSGSWEMDNVATGTTLVTTNNQYFQFGINTTGIESVTLSFAAQRTTQGARNLQLYYGAAAGTASNVYSLASAGSWSAFGPLTINTGLNASGITLFRFYVYNAGVTNNGHSIYMDDVTFTGCGTPQQPTLTKAFTPSVIAANGTSSLTFTLTNPNQIALTNASFTDDLPSGMTVANPTGASTTCGGTWTPTSGNTSLSFSGGTIPANGSCTVTVAVTTTVAGPSTNVSGFISTTQTGQNNGTGGSAAATLTVVLPPELDKIFSPNPILAGGTSTLTFKVTNPNPNTAISGVAFTDNLPAGVVIANPPTASTSGCGSPTFAPVAGSGVATFSGGTIAAGGTCTASVNVTASGTGTYNNVTSNVTHIVNSQTVAGNTASDTLTVNAPSPSITLLKQVGLNTGSEPWLTYLALPEGQGLYYLLTIENTGDVPLTGITINDPTVNASGCVWSDPLPVASASNENHIDTCIIGPVTAIAGETINTAQASGTYNSTPYTDNASAAYATTGLTVVKAATPTSYTAAGETINYTFTVTNSGSATLSGPITIDDDITTDEACPELNTIGNNDNFFNPSEQIECTASYLTTSSDVNAGSVVNIASASAEDTTSPTDTVTVTGPAIPIEANNDNFSGTPIVGATGGNTATVYTNDTLNSVAFANTDVTPSITADGGLTGVSINADGTITVPAGTPANTYTVSYQICQALNATNCDTADVTIVVSAAAIVANDDDFSGTPIASSAGGNTATVYTNDMLNGAAFATTDVTPSITADGGLTGVSINADGTITVPAGTPANTYTVSYQICEVLNPTNCDPANVTIVVAANPIVANNDDFSTTPITSGAGGNTSTVYTNDTLNGVAFATSDVTASITADGGLTGVSINADGTITVPPGTPPNSYTVTYEICEAANPTNCDTADVTIVVASNSIVANNDDFSATPITSGAGGNTPTVYTNDTLNGVAFATTDVTASITGNGGLTGVSINADGTVSVPAGTAPATYTITYEICEVANPTNCDTADVTIVVVADVIDAINDDFSTTPITSGTGGDTPSVFTNDTLNGVPFAPTDVTANITDDGGITGVLINADGTLTIPPGTPPGSYTIVYEICEVANPTNCDTGSVTVVVAANPIVATNDDFTTSPVSGGTGGDTPSVFTNDTLNGVPFAPTDVTASITDDGGITGILINADGTLTIPPGTPPGSYTIVYEICEVANPTNCDTAEAIVAINAAGMADLSVDKTANVTSMGDPTQFAVDDVIEYTITLTNIGAETANNVVVEDRLSANLEFTAITGGTMSGSCAHDGTNPGGTITCNVASILSGTQLTLVYNVRVDSLLTGPTDTYSNVAEVMASDEPDPNSTPGNGVPTEDDYISLELPWIYDPPYGVKTNDGGDPVLQWSMIWYNPTPVDATNVTVTDPILAGTTYRGPVTCNVFGSSVTTRCEYDAGTDSIIWEGTIAGITPGGTIQDNRLEITFVVDVDDSIDDLENIASLTIPSFGTGPFTTQASSSWSLTATPTPTTPAPPTETNEPPAQPTSAATAEATPLPSEPTLTPQLDPEALGVTELPSTGETPSWRPLLILFIGGLLGVCVIAWGYIRKHFLQRD